ncbi:MAG: hypothetical protein J6X00_00030 [Clostridia bacterium]|nr:hypothetical protein [Clostridia bacterium]
MNKFKTLFVMQLKEKMNLSFLNSKKQTLFKVVFGVLGFGVITAAAYLILWLCKYLHLFSASGMIPLSVITVIYLLIFILNAFTCTVGLSKTLYYAKDNQVLITYPVTANQLFLSKMLVYYISEIKKTFTFAIPIFVAYGVLSNFSILYYPWVIVMLLILAAVPVLLGGLLSIPANYVIKFLNRFPLIKVALLVVLLGGLVFVVVKIIGMIPENINLIESWSTISKGVRVFLNWITKYFYAFYAIAIFLCGKFTGLKATLFTDYSWIVLLVLVGTICTLLVLNYLISRPLYLKIASRQFEFDKANVKRNKLNLPRGKGFWSACYYETLRCIRDPHVLSSAVLTIIVCPILILLQNAVYAAINTRLSGDNLIICFNVLIILLFATANNITVSSAYSKDGDALYLNKTKPNRTYEVLVPRLVFNFVASIIVVVPACSIFMVRARLTDVEKIYLLLMLMFVTFGHLIWSADIDFIHPQSNLYKREGSSVVSVNELKSTILAFAISILTFGVTYFFLADARKFIWLKLCVIAFVFMVVRIWLFNYKARVLYKEMDL